MEVRSKKNEERIKIQLTRYPKNKQETNYKYQKRKER
jgi:hypothetical protein